MPTEKLYYQDAYLKEFDACVLSCEPKGKDFLVTLDRSAFYPEGGGQPADRGKLGALEVLDVHERDGVIVHTCRPAKQYAESGAGIDPGAEAGAGAGTDPGAEAGTGSGAGAGTDPGAEAGAGTRAGAGTDPGAEAGAGAGAGAGTDRTLPEPTACPPEAAGLPAPGSTVHCVLDWERRFDHMQQHSGEHIVSGMLCSRFHCDNVGFHLGADFITIDYNAEISEEDLRAVEADANRYLWEAHPFLELWPSPEELERIDYRSKKALTGAVRITEFPGADRCACCGTHVKNSSEVGLVKLFSAQKFREGTRIQMMSGGRALRYLSACYEQNLICSRETSSKPPETGEGVRILKQEYLALKGRAIGLENECFAHIASELSAVPSPVRFSGPMPAESVKKLCVAIAEQAKGRVCVFAGEETSWKYALIEEGADLRPFVKKLNETLSGRGGGRGGFAQGSLSASRKEIEAFLSSEGNRDAE